jgi:pimeloyl-ACP methyl ester carboxylesterase
MSRRQAALVTAGLAGAAVAGVVGRTVLNARRRSEPDGHDLGAFPPEDLGPVRSFDGTELAVRAAGPADGPLLVFAHGFSLDLTSWHYQWTGLAERFRCVLLDFRSHGRSGRAAAGDLSPAAFGHDLAAVLDSLPDGRSAVVVGHSMGAMAVLAMAEARPDLFGGRVAGAVFVGAATNDLVRGAMGAITELLRPRLGTIRQAARRMNRLREAVVSRPGDVGHLVARVTQFGHHVSPSVVDHVVALAARAPSEVWTDGLAGLVDLDLRHALRHVRVPALVVVGEHDRVTPPPSAVALAHRLPEGRLEMIPEVGHMPMLEAPEAFNERVAAFARPLLEPSRRRGTT